MRTYSALLALLFTCCVAFAPVGFSLTNSDTFDQEKKSFAVNVSYHTVDAFHFGIPDNNNGAEEAQEEEVCEEGEACEDGMGNENPIVPDTTNDEEEIAGVDNENLKSLKCGRFDIGCRLTVFIVDLITAIPFFIAIVMGVLSDLFLGLSINPASYGVPGSGLESGIRDAWKIIRDFANIGFIFSLFISAFMLILNKTSVNGTPFDPKRTVVRVIIMALLVNFSLLFCRIIIQTADVFSHVLYNKISAEKDYNTTIANGVSAILGKDYKSIALPIIDGADPQSLFIDNGTSLKEGGSNAAYLIVGFISFFILLIYIHLFATMMLIFLGRIIGLWIGIILSPLAFVSWSVPFLEKNEFIGFDNWIKNFSQLAFLTPIYLFFIYLTVSILNIQGFGDLVENASSESNWIVKVFAIVLKMLIPLLISVFLLLQGKKLAIKMSGEIGGIVAKASGAISGLALGAATGGTALLGRQTVGQLGAWTASATSKSTGYFGKKINTASKAVSASTFDVRNNKFAMDKFSKLTGKAGESIDLGSKGLQKEGGYAATGDLRDIWKTRKERIAKEQAEKEEKEALERANNPQSKENTAQREAEQAKANNEKAIQAEQSRIATIAENTPITITAEKIDIESQLTTNSAEISAIESALQGKQEMTEQELITNKAEQEVAEQELIKAKTTAADIDARIAENAKKKPQGGDKIEIDNQEKAIQAEKIALEQEKIDNGNQQSTLQADIDSKKAKEQEHQEVQDLKKQKEQLEEKGSGLTAKLDTLQSIDGKTPEQLKQLAERNKIEGQNSPEGKELARIEKEIEEENKKINEMAKKEKELRKEGNKTAADELKAKITKEEKKRADRKGKNDKGEEGDHSKAKAAYNKKYGTSIEDLENTAKKSLKANVKNLEDTSVRLAELSSQKKDIAEKLVEANQAVLNRRKEILNAQATGLDELGTELHNPRFGLSANASRTITNTVGVITNGRIGTVRNAGENAATNVRNNARSGK